MPYISDKEEYAWLPEQFLKTLDQQRKYLHMVGAEPAPCPMCTRAVNNYTATGDLYTVQGDGSSVDYEYCCPHCGTRLEEVVPFQTAGARRQWAVNRIMASEKCFGTI